MHYPHTLLPLLALCCATTAAAADNCFTQKYAQYADAQARWQQASTELVIDRKPALAEVATRYMQDQLNRIAKNRLAVELVAELSPGRLETNLSLDHWLYLNDKAEQALARRDVRYAELLRRVEAIKALPPHPDGDVLRTAMHKEIMPLPEFKALLEKLNAEVEAANQIKCEPTKP